MRYEVIWSIAAKKDLDRLGDILARRIVAKVHLYAASPNPMKFAKGLMGNFTGYYRFRIGKYRVIFEKETYSQIVLLLILSVDKRDNTYF